VGGFLRLRQVCLVAADLGREAERLESIFDLAICHRDPNVGKYGLANVLFPIGTDFVEIVSPTRDGTAAGRFLARHGGKYGYMAIFDCDDPEARRKHAESMGVRVANLIRHDAYFGVQLHPKDTGAAMIEFNATEGGADPMGPYSPAGPQWQRAIRTGTTRRLLGIEIEAPDAPGLAAHWGRILERPVEASGAKSRIALESGAVDFLPSTAPEAVLAGVNLEVTEPAAILAAAKAQGCETGGDYIVACGVRFRLATA
jgi:hypothetical protein